MLVAPAVTSTQAPGILRLWKQQAPNHRTSCSSSSRGQPSTQHHADLCVSCVRASAHAAEPRHPWQPPICLPFQLGVSGAASHGQRCELCDGTQPVRFGYLRPVDAVLAWGHLRLEDGTTCDPTSSGTGIVMWDNCPAAQTRVCYIELYTIGDRQVAT